MMRTTPLYPDEAAEIARRMELAGVEKWGPDGRRSSEYLLIYNAVRQAGYRQRNLVKVKARHRREVA